MKQRIPWHRRRKRIQTLQQRADDHVYIYHSRALFGHGAVYEITQEPIVIRVVVRREQTEKYAQKHRIDPKR